MFNSIYQMSEIIQIFRLYTQCSLFSNRFRRKLSNWFNDLLRIEDLFKRTKDLYKIQDLLRTKDLIQDLLRTKDLFKIKDLHVYRIKDLI